MKKPIHNSSPGHSGKHCRRTGMEPEDAISVRINGQEIEDVFDYHYLVNDEYLELLVQEAGRRGVGAGDREGSGGGSGH